MYKANLKIAILSGTIPSSTFIEHLIEGVAKTHFVYLFGVPHKRIKYSNKNICVYATPVSHVKNLWLTIYRTLLLLFLRPKDLIKLFPETKKQLGLYNRFIRYSKLLPIVLYRPDVIHLQWAKQVINYMCLQDVFNIPIVLSLRGAHINYSPIIDANLAHIYRQEFPKIKAFHAVSNAIALEAEKYFAAPDKIRLIHSPIPQLAIAQFSPYEKKEKTLKIVTIGRFHWVKGMRYMFQAISELKSIPFQYSCISSNAVTEEVLFQMQQLKITDQVKIIPGLAQKDLFKFLKTCDVLVLPSLQEGIANVVLEAMALGVPVISTNCGGMAEVVIPNQTGWLVPVRNPKAIADAILDFANTSEAELQRITTNAHQLVKKHFQSKTSIQQFLELYQLALKTENKPN